ncbi:hypothetical protein J2W80_000802 [Methylorubrum extorquens]|nr:hypothetical protein [Methylorubrum extorquens]MCP1586472.1 hypothetical protein [Methylorubrum extorquens]
MVPAQGGDAVINERGPCAGETRDEIRSLLRRDDVAGAQRSVLGQRHQQRRGTRRLTGAVLDAGAAIEVSRGGTQIGPAVEGNGPLEFGPPRRQGEQLGRCIGTGCGAGRRVNREIGPRMQAAEGEDVAVATAHADGPRPCGEGGRRGRPRSGANGRRTRIQARRPLHEAMSGDAPWIGERRVAPGCLRRRLCDRRRRGARRPEHRLEQPVEQTTLRGPHHRRRADRPKADQQAYQRGVDETAAWLHPCCAGTALVHPCAGRTLAEPHRCRPRRSGAFATKTRPARRFARDPASRLLAGRTMSANHAGTAASAG